MTSPFKNKTAKLGVIGLGYVGLPLAVEFAAAGYSVVGFDVVIVYFLKKIGACKVIIEVFSFFHYA